MVSTYVWVIIGAGVLFVAYVAFTFIKMYLDDRERRRREAEGGGPYSSSSDNENGYIGLDAFRDSQGNDAGGLESVREGVDRGGINSAAASA
ncbi:ATP-binding Cassette (ABC) Superfamily [Phytophthora cinnamomi]|uniref:ATP-binding Cassette (ABC) Superfamily n=1 Tax=Phytophthora cinnamomi TaxID=4785 RepID=UPI00355A813D|nr:ATP-binding Cassette (ABC) Superfamily [Phytophthora cinnamomi]